jgi:hypothetical protein
MTTISKILGSRHFFILLQSFFVFLSVFSCIQRKVSISNYPPGIKLQYGFLADRQLIDSRYIEDYNFYMQVLAHIEIRPRPQKKPTIVFLTSEEQMVYAEWRSKMVDSLISETKRTAKSWCAAHTHFVFADGMDTTKPMVSYTAIPYGRKGYEQARPKLSARKRAKLERQAKLIGMSLDSNAFFCTATLLQ